MDVTCDGQSPAYRPIVLIPVYNHEKTLPLVLSQVRRLGLDCLLVDDGSTMPCAAVVERLARQEGVMSMRLANNRGKGAAVTLGLLAAFARGYSHALQIDADGQHDLSVIESFLNASRQQPEALIGGEPIYGQDAPKSRLYGRWIMRLWVWINSLSRQIPDAMCGFRVYPLVSVAKLLEQEWLGERMEFDPEILIRLSWRGVPMRWLPLKVNYPQGGVSHFRLWRDNALISLMHARLFFGMLYRAPWLLWRRWQKANSSAEGKPKRAGHWAEQSERGSLLLMRLGFAAVQRLGRPLLMPMIWLVVGYFYLSRRTERLAISEYQQRLRRFTLGKVALPRRFAVYRQYLAFADTLLDKLDVWRGNISRADLTLIDPHGVHQQLGQGRGQILVTAHLGNAEITRALVSQVPDLQINILMHSRNAQRFSQVLAAAGASAHLIEVSELDTALMLDLAQRLERGQWLAIAADRVPIHRERTTAVQFLGSEAQLPQGPWLLAALLRCPVNLLLCLPEGNKRFSVILERLGEIPAVPRSQWAQQIAQQAQRYADRLAHYCQQKPLQWFNFYPFWEDKGSASTRKNQR